MKKSKFLALLLTVSMVLGITPTAVFADDSVGDSANIIETSIGSAEEQSEADNSQLRDVLRVQSDSTEQVKTYSDDACTCIKPCVGELVDSNCSVCTKEAEQCASHGIWFYDATNENNSGYCSEDYNPAEHKDKNDAPKAEYSNLENFPQVLNDMIDECEGKSYTEMMAIGRKYLSNDSISQQVYNKLFKEPNEDGTVTYKGAGYALQFTADGKTVTVSKDSSYKSIHWSGRAADHIMFQKNVENIKFADDVTLVDKAIFYNFVNVKATNIAWNNVTEVGGNTFFGCDLTNDGVLDLKNSKIEKLFSFAFCDYFNVGRTPITDVYLPDTIQSVGKEVFHTGSSANVKLWVDTSKVSEDVINGISASTGCKIFDVNSTGNADGITWVIGSGTLYLDGTGAISDYTADNKAPWDGKAYNGVVIGTGITSIGNNAFSGVDTLVVPPTVTKMSDNALEGVKTAYIANKDLAENYGAKKAVHFDYFFYTQDYEGVNSSTRDTWIGISNDTIYAGGNGSIKAKAWNADSRKFPKELEEAYHNCTKLVFVNDNTGNGITTLGGGIFAGTYIEDIDFTGAPNLETIGNNTFMSTYVTKVVVPSTVKTVGSYNFGYYSNPYAYAAANDYENYKITGKNPDSITFENPNVELGAEVFTPGSGISKILMSAHLKDDGTSAVKAYADKNSSIFHNLTTPNWGSDGTVNWYLRDISEDLNDTEFSLVISGSGAVNANDGWLQDYYKNKVSDITFESGITEIGERAFFDMEGLKTVTIGDDVANVGNQAFALSTPGGEDKTLSFVIRNSATTFNGVALNAEGDTTRENRPGGVDTNIVAKGNYGEVITEGSLATDTEPAKDAVRADNVTYQIYRNEDGADTYTMELKGKGNIGSFGYNGIIFNATHLSPQPAEIRDNYRTKITRVIVNDGINLGYGCLASFSALKEITLPTSMTQLRDNAFLNSFAEGAKINFADYDESLKLDNEVIAMQIPANITSVGAYFGRYDSKSVPQFKAVYFANPETELTQNTFYGSPDVTLVVKANGQENAIKTFAEDNNYKYYDLTDPNNKNGETAKIVWEVSSGILTIEKKADAESPIVINKGDFTGIDVSAIKKISIKSGVEIIGEEAFAGFTGLTSVELPKSIQSIGNKAFSVDEGTEAAKLTIEIPKATKVGSNIFENRVSDKVDVTVNADAANDTLKGEGFKPTYEPSFKILLIGNSYSEDASGYNTQGYGSRLYEMLKNAYPDKKIVVGLAANGGKTLSWHYQRALNNEAVEGFRVVEGGSWRNVGTYTLANALEWADWDVVTLQPYSPEPTTGAGGTNHSESDIVSKSLTETVPGMVEIVAEHAPAAKDNIYLYAHWSSSSDYSKLNVGSVDFEKSVTNLITAKYTGIKDVIPVGTAIQNERNTYLAYLNHNVDVPTNEVKIENDRMAGLLRDGGHLAYNVGRYTAALTFASKITGVDMDTLMKDVYREYPGNITQPDDYMNIVKMAVAEAIAHPDGITTNEDLLKKNTSPATMAKNAIVTAVAEEKNYVANIVKGKAKNEYPAAIKAMAENILTELKVTYPELTVGDVAVTTATTKDTTLNKDVTTYTATVPVSFGYDTAEATVTWSSTGIEESTVYVVYKVEHYTEELDGTYTKTEEMKSAPENTSVEAVPKTDAHHVVNTEKSTLTGNVVKPKVDNNGDVQLLTLKVYYDLDNHTVTFNTDGGTEVAAKTVKHGKLAEKPSTDPVKGRYRFLGWYTDASLTTAFDFSKAITEDTTVYAGWKKKSSSSSSDTSAPTYSVSTGKTENGTISVTPAKAEAGEKVTIKATPDSGYQLDEVTVKDKNNSNVKLTKVNDNEYTFTMPSGKVSVDATFVQKDATDDNQNNAGEKNKVIKLQIGSRIVTVDNEAVIYDVAPVIRNDRTLVPIRVVTETLGGKVDWNGVTKEVTLNIDGKEIKMTVGKTLEKYGVAPVIIDGRTFVPVRFVADELGATVAWDDATKTVTITKIEK